MEINLDKVGLRRLMPSDADHLLKWLSDPAVLEFYEGRDYRCSPEVIQEEYYTPEPWKECWAITYDDVPVGYIHSCYVTEEMKLIYSYDGNEEIIYAIDQFIGEPELWGKGIGKKFLRLIQDYLVREKGAQVVLLDPHADNPRALRTYLAVGFQVVKFLPAHELHEGIMQDCWLMAWYPDGRKLAGSIIPLYGNRNLRELGGIKNRDGKEIRPGLLYRSGALDGLSKADCEYLYRIGIRSVADLRTMEEAQRAPDSLNGYQDIQVYSFPLLDGIFSCLDGSVFTADLPKMYCALLDGVTSQLMIVDLFRKLPGLMEKGGVIIHCTAGKDRTGVAIMLLLELFGVEDKAIVENYALSQELLEDPLKIQLRLEQSYKQKIPIALFQSPKENAEFFLGYLREKYGSARDFLKSAGMKDEELDRLVRLMGE